MALVQKQKQIESKAIENDGDLRALSLSTPIGLQTPRQKRGNTTCGQKMKKSKKVTLLKSEFVTF